MSTHLRLKNFFRDEFSQFTHRGNIMSGAVLYRYSPYRSNKEPQLIVPMNQQENILRKCPDDPTASHYGSEQAIERIVRHYYWIGMSRHITDHVNVLSVGGTKPTTISPRIWCRPRLSGRGLRSYLSTFLGPWYQDRKYTATSWSPSKRLPPRHALPSCCRRFC